MGSDILFSLGIDAKTVDETLRQVARAVEATTAPLPRPRLRDRLRNWWTK